MSGGYIILSVIIVGLLLSSRTRFIAVIMAVALAGIIMRKMLNDAGMWPF